jgi:hypothetical protein
VRVEAVQLFLAGAILIVISFDTGHSDFADYREALFGIGPVTHDVTHAGIMRAFLLLDVIQHHLERFQIRVDISYDRKLHL